MTQKQLADALMVSHGLVRAMEIGGRNITKRTAAQVRALKSTKGE
jgi:transcriptional regulator with XRE-family HTH domain